MGSRCRAAGLEQHHDPFPPSRRPKLEPRSLQLVSQQGARSAQCHVAVVARAHHRATRRQRYRDALLAIDARVAYTKRSELCDRSWRWRDWALTRDWEG